MKKKIIIISVGAILIALIVGAAAFSQSQYFQIGQDVNAIKQLPNGKQVVAKVNGKDISIEQFKTQKYMQDKATAQLNQKPPSGAEILKQLAKTELLYEEAKRRGIEVSNEDLKEFMDNNRKNLETLPAEEQQRLKDYVVGLGLSVDEYWKDPEVIEGYRQDMYIGKLRDLFLMNAHTPEEVKDAEIEYEKLGDSLLSNAKIEIIEPATVR